MQALTAAFLAATLGLTVFAPAPLPPDRKKKDEPKAGGVVTLDMLQGVWVQKSTVRWTPGGLVEEKAPPVMLNYEITINGREWARARKAAKKPLASGMLEITNLDTSKPPTVIDVKRKTSTLGQYGVIELVGNEL